MLASLRRLHDPGAGYKYRDILTYLLSGTELAANRHRANLHNMINIKLLNISFNFTVI